MKTRFDNIDDFVDFLVIDMDAARNALLGRQWMQKTTETPSIHHLYRKYHLRKAQGMIPTGNDPFLEAEVYDAYACFSKMKLIKRMEREC